MHSISELLSATIIAVRKTLSVQDGLDDLMTPLAVAAIERHLSDARRALAENDIIKMAKAYAAIRLYAK